jgi:hypothetical protein
MTHHTLWRQSKKKKTKLHGSASANLEYTLLQDFRRITRLFISDDNASQVLRLHYLAMLMDNCSLNLKKSGENGS